MMMVIYEISDGCDNLMEGVPVTYFGAAHGATLFTTMVLLDAENPWILTAGVVLTEIIIQQLRQQNDNQQINFCGIKSTTLELSSRTSGKLRCFSSVHVYDEYM